MKRLVENRGLDMLVDGFLYQGTVKEEEISKYISGFRDEKVKERLLKDYDFQRATKNLPNMAFWRGLRRINDVERKAEEYVKRWKGSSEKEREGLRRELGIVENAGGVISSEFLDAVVRIQSQRIGNEKEE